MILGKGSVEYRLGMWEEVHHEMENTVRDKKRRSHIDRIVNMSEQHDRSKEE